VYPYDMNTMLNVESKSGVVHVYEFASHGHEIKYSQILETQTCFLKLENKIKLFKLEIF